MPSEEARSVDVWTCLFFFLAFIFQVWHQSVVFHSNSYFYAAYFLSSTSYGLFRRTSFLYFFFYKYIYMCKCIFQFGKASLMYSVCFSNQMINKNMLWCDFCQCKYSCCPAGGAVVHSESRYCTFSFCRWFFQAFALCLQLDWEFFLSLACVCCLQKPRTLSPLSSGRAGRDVRTLHCPPTHPASIDHMSWLKMWVIVFVTTQDSPGYENEVCWLAAPRERDSLPSQDQQKLGVEHSTDCGTSSVFEKRKTLVTVCKRCGPTSLSYFLRVHFIYLFIYSCIYLQISIQSWW